MDELYAILDSLADRLCERRAYRCLLRFMPAYFAPNGLTDGWESCREALGETRALCRDYLLDDEMEDIEKAVNLIDRVLTGR